MGEFGLVALTAAAAIAGAGLVLLVQGRAARARRTGASSGVGVDEDLEAQLTRARAIPGAEPLLDRLSRQPVIFARELADFTAQLDNLERKAKVEAARKGAFMERMAPVTARYAKEAMASYKASRAKPAPPDLRKS